MINAEIMREILEYQLFEQCRSKEMFCSKYNEIELILKYIDMNNEFDFHDSVLSNISED